jgi:hypothetical protein
MLKHSRLNGTKLAVGLSAAALLVAVLGATPVGHAAARLIVPKNSVGKAQLKKGAVTGLKVKDGTLTTADFKASQLQAGSQGPKGDRGDAGPEGPAGISGYQVVKTTSGNVAPGEIGHAGPGCPAGKKPIGGGVSSGQPVAIVDSVPDGQYWYVNAQNVGPTATAIAAYVVCATISS